MSNEPPASLPRAEPGPYGAPPPGPASYGPPPHGPVPMSAPPSNTMAIVSLICSILGLTLLPGLGSVVGIVAGHIALSQLRTRHEGGRGMAIAGLIVGYSGVVIIGLVVLAFAYAAAGLGLLVWMY